jgi:parallel beta-helix repeat protein
MASGLTLTLILAGTLTLAFSSQRAHTQEGWIFIRPDGTAQGGPISTVDNVTYTLTGNAWRIDVQRNNIVLDGSGYTVQGSSFAIWVHADNVTIRNVEITDSGVGINLEDRYYDEEIRNIYISENNITGNQMCVRVHESYNVTIERNTLANSLEWGLYLDKAVNTTVWGNNITNNAYHGIHLIEAVNTTVWGNNIMNNAYTGVHAMWSDGHSNNIFYHNNFINNTKHVDAGGDTGEAGTWDNGYPSCGNYWDDYTGVDADGDGVGDTPYIMLSAGGKYENVDNYPLMNPWTSSWAPLEPSTVPLWMQWWFYAIVAVVIVTLAGAAYILTKKKQPATTPQET